ncbi:MAG TPA: methyltransferase [Vicinamibacterales bacterium]|jgi:hypothetical protein
MSANGNPVQAIWQKLDLMTPMALRVAATLRLADHIGDSPRTDEEIAARASADRDAVARLLSFLAARGIFSEPAPGCFAVNEMAAVLRDDHPSGTRRWIDLNGFGGDMDRAVFELLDAVRGTRKPANAAPETAASFDSLMEAGTRAQAAPLIAACDFAGVSHVVDVGGGTGVLLAEALRVHPSLRGMLIELPGTAANARSQLAAAGVAERCEVMAGSMFDVAMPAADAYILKFLLHGCNDADAIGVLRRCREASAAGSRVWIMERTVADGDGLAQFTGMDLLMLVLNEGRERTIAAYSALADQAGLVLRTATPTRAQIHVLEMVHSRNQEAGIRKQA